MKFLLLLSTLFILTNSYANKVLKISSPKGAKVQEISYLVLKEAYSKIGYEIVVEYTPNSRSLLMVDTGNYDGEMSRVKGLDEKYKNIIRVPISVNTIEAHAFSKNKDISVSRWEDLKNYNLVCVRGVKFVEQNLNKRDIDCSYVTYYKQVINMLSLNRVDLAVIPRINGMNQIKEEKEKGIHLINPPLQKSDLYHYLHKKHLDIVPKLEAQLLDMQKSGRIEEIRKFFLLENGL